VNIVLAIPGHLKTVPMGGFCAEALRELGHRVTVVDFRSQWTDKVREKLAGKSDEEKVSINRRIRCIVERTSPDAFITLFGFDISVQTLAWLRERKIPSACWWINDPFQFERSARKGGHYDFLFSNSAGSVDDYRAAGIAQAHFLPTACQPAIHHGGPVRDAYRCDICFAGDWSPLRERMMLGLLDRFDLRIFGPWGKKLAADSPLRARLTEGFFTPQEMTAMFNSAGIVLNLHTWYGKFEYGVNPRLFEASACGAVQLVDRKREIPELFAVDREIFLYESLEDVAAAARDILALPADSRRAVGDAALQRAHAEHSYRHRMASLLATMGAAGA